MTPLEQKLNQLSLSTISRQLETTLTEAAARNLSAAATLEWLADMELEARKQRAIDRRFKCSRLQAQPSIDAFHFLHHKSRQQAKPRILRLLDLSFLDKGTNLVLIGNPGAGKSHLLCALAHELIAQGRRMKYTSCAMLVQDLLVAKRDLRLSKEIKKLGRHDGLIIDEMGYVQQSREEMEVLFTLLSERYERGSVLLTSNLPFSKWEGIFKDPMTTAAAIDRLVHHSVIVELNIPSYRMEEAKKNRDPMPDGREAA